jgi:hypothetical protein
VIMNWNSRKRNLLSGSTKAADLPRDRARSSRPQLPTGLAGRCSRSAR